MDGQPSAMLSVLAILISVIALISMFVMQTKSFSDLSDTNVTDPAPGHVPIFDADGTLNHGHLKFENLEDASGTELVKYSTYPVMYDSVSKTYMAKDLLFGAIYQVVPGPGGPYAVTFPITAPPPTGNSYLFDIKRNTALDLELENIKIDKDDPRYFELNKGVYRIHINMIVDGITSNFWVSKGLSLRTKGGKILQFTEEGHNILVANLNPSVEPLRFHITHSKFFNFDEDVSLGLFYETDEDPLTITFSLSRLDIQQIR